MNLDGLAHLKSVVVVVVVVVPGLHKASGLGRAVCFHEACSP